MAPHTRRSATPPISPLTPPIRQRAAKQVRLPKYPAWLSHAVVQDVLNDPLDIGPAAFQMQDLRSHVEVREKGEVVFVERGQWEERKRKERAKRQKRKRSGGMSRAARKAAWKRGGGGGRKRAADGKFAGGRVEEEG